MISWKYRFFLILLAGLAWIWVSRALQGSTTDGGIPAPHQGFLAPDFSLQTSTGEIITLSDMRGRAVLINIWASWCSPCRAEMPAMDRVYQEYQTKDFLILAVNATNQDDPAKAVAFAQEYDLTFPILFDVDGSVSHQYQVRALPTSFFVDQAGIIQDVIVGGPISEALLRIRVENLIEGAAQEAP